MKLKPFYLLLIIGALATVAGLIVFFVQRKNQTLSPLSSQPDDLALVSYLTQSGVEISSSPIVLGETIQASISGMTVLFSRSKDLKKEVQTLQLLLPRLKMDEPKVSEIDLRFNKVVLRY